ncbi:uncharacterized protein F4812DRAFT_285316 [Daldinia caldariorum]|uniref:uncharacterized protein n=1 Tax=Daldinia caldariorum TaxID=326644 RepID=UPI0020088BD8|nr:uncharacterized protein F4812DRAFT_285316 [Daldinia caldariorum]KAI1463140.1 hypothetical protein F4812DRAFT_285316 [Daldinia caldariorum]
MKVSAVLAFATTALAASLQRRQVQNRDIVNFAADCIPHSTFCSYNFNVVTESFFPLDTCSAFVQGPDNLPEITEGKCNNTAYTWSTTKSSDGGLKFAIWYPFNSRSNITYCHTIPASQIVTQNNGAVSTQHYTGPRNFTASIFDCPLPTDGN